MQLAAIDLACVRAGRAVFAGLSFALAAGEAMTVLGRNGAGKTSLLRLIAGLLRPAAGQISIEGGDADLSLAEQCHYLGHQDAAKPILTVAENLAFWAHYLGSGKNPGALAALGLEALADIPAAYLSAGQRRRLSLARLIAAPRPIWLLDEPAASLDAAAQERLGEIMREHLAGGGIVVAATHGPLTLDGAKVLHLDHMPSRAPAAATASDAPGEWA